MNIQSYLKTKQENVHCCVEFKKDQNNLLNKFFKKMKINKTQNSM